MHYCYRATSKDDVLKLGLETGPHHKPYEVARLKNPCFKANESVCWLFAIGIKNLEFFIFFWMSVSLWQDGAASWVQPYIPFKQRGSIKFTFCPTKDFQLPNHNHATWKVKSIISLKESSFYEDLLIRDVL